MISFLTLCSKKQLKAKVNNSNSHVSNEIWKTFVVSIIVTFASGDQNVVDESITDKKQYDYDVFSRQIWQPSHRF